MSPIHTLKDIVRIYYTYRREAHIAFAGFIVALVIALLVIPPRYTSEVELLVKPGRDNTVPLELSDRAAISVQSPLRDHMLDEIDLLQNPDLVAEVAAKHVELVAPRPRPGFWGTVRDATEGMVGAVTTKLGDAAIALGIADRMSPEARLARLLSGRFAVDYARGAGVLHVSFTWSDPQIAHDVLATWIEAYLKRRVPIFANDDVLAFFDQQTRSAGEQLAAKETAITALQTRFGSFDLARREADLNRRLDDLSKQHDGLDRDRQSAAALLDEAKKRLDAATAFVTKETVSAENPAHRELETRLYNEMMRRLDQLKTYNSGATPVQQIDASISQVQAWLSQQAPTTTQSETKEANPLRSELSKGIQDTALRLVEVTSALHALDDQIKDVTAERDGVITAGIQFDQLSRDVETAKTAYLDDLHDLERSRKDRMLDLSRISNVAVAQQPTLNFARTFPPTLPFLAASPLLAAIFAGLVIYVLAITDRRIRDNLNFANQLGLPLLAVIPEFATAGASDQRATADAISALHYLQPRLPRPNGDGDMVTIGFVGLDPDDGLHDLVAALRHLYSEPPAALGADAAAGQAEPANVVLIDSPPLGSGRRSLDSLKTADSIVFVVEWGRATMPRVRHAIEVLRSIFGDRLLGIVVNRKRMVIPSGLYRLLQ